MERWVGIDVGAETLKLAEVVTGDGHPRVARALTVAHGKAPGPRLVEALERWDWEAVAGAVCTGRLSRRLALARLPSKQALQRGFRFVWGDRPATVVSIGSRGFAVLELRATGAPVWRESARCAQGTGNFLRQLVERFGLTVEEAAQRAEGVPDPAPLSGRCPVILKTDMTHLANKGERHERILAGLFDAIAETAEALVKPRHAPPEVLLAGGVARSRRVREHFAEFLARSGHTLLDADPEASLFLEAIGCAAHAAASRAGTTPLAALVGDGDEAPLALGPPLRGALARVRRMPASPMRVGAVDEAREVLVGLDIGSTGSKVVALDATTREPLWEGYCRTGGDPVGAAQRLVRDLAAGPGRGWALRAFGATGSGREIVGSLLATCYGPEAVFVLNEIAAHARGAVHFDARVDTIFEIGGQDAKYIRLAGGRVVDAAMNEACSAGTGSFIEEQGRRFEGIEDVSRLGEVALGAGASAGLGQHCSIFMAEVIDEAIARGVGQDDIVAGLHESVVANYLNRVKGSRSVGEVIFCQGMPFASDALAAAVARQTGAEVIVPPSPGTIGALGIALLAAEGLALEGRPALDPALFLAARVETKDTFVCKATSGCGGAGNKCRIDRLTTRVLEERRKYTWGGGCALHDRGTRTRKLPDGTPDPFRIRGELVAELLARLGDRCGGRRVALADAFQLKGMLPFFATFLHGLGLDLEVLPGATRDDLRRGVEAANVPFCAPMQQAHGIAARLAATRADLLFLPMVREIPRVAGERASQLCPIVQGSPDVLAHDLGPELADRLLSPVIDVGPGALDAPVLLASCERLAAVLGAPELAWRPAWERARAAQLEFDARLLEAGQAALDRCARDGLVPVVVLGRTYTIHDEVLNSNVPAILRDQGAVAIPLDAYPVGADVPVFPNMYWGHAQRMLRAAWQVRRTPGQHAIFASNYSCGPDSFTFHLLRDLMGGKPFAVIETDGHAGDAGTKTRVEAFLHCVREHEASGARAPASSGERLTVRSRTVRDIATAGDTVLLPYMGDGAHVVGAALRGFGVKAEVLPEPGPEALRLGRRHTSGKECLPLVLTLGSLLERLERAAAEHAAGAGGAVPPGSSARFAFFMPGADGPCRFGAYKELHQLVTDRLGHAGRVSIWSPPFGDYFQDVPPGLGALVLAGAFGTDLLTDMLHEVRPRETVPGAASWLYRSYLAELVALVERAAGKELGAARVLAEAATGRVFGVPALLARAGREFRALRREVALPTVLVVGEIYLRLVPFGNGRVIEALERRGLAARLAPATEFLQYSDWSGTLGRPRGLGERLNGWVRGRIEGATTAAAGAAMGWPAHARVPEVVAAAAPWMRAALEGETVLTVGSAVHAWRHGSVDAVVAVGPLECMPNKLAEAQLAHVGEREGLPSITLSLHGDGIDPEPLDGFALEVRERFAAREAAARPVEIAAATHAAAAAGSSLSSGRPVTPAIRPVSNPVST